MSTMPTKPKKVTNQKVMGTKSILRKALPIDSHFCFVFVLFFVFCCFFRFCTIFLFLLSPYRSTCYLSMSFSLLSICATRGRWGMDCGNHSCTYHLIPLSNIPYSLHHLDVFFVLFRSFINFVDNVPVLIASNVHNLDVIGAPPVFYHHRILNQWVEILIQVSTDDLYVISVI